MEEIKSISGQDSLSSREVNRLKRKARMDARASKARRRKRRPRTIQRKWPLESFYDQLLSDLFSPRWERRHGTATGLLELVKRHSESGGQLQGCDREENDQRHSLCLEDLLVRLLSVLALDRFGD